MNSGVFRSPHTLLSRRAALRSALGAGALLALPPAARSHTAVGAVRPPLATPRLRVRTLEGRDADLATLLRDKVTAVQLMFTGCSATCPIQGAVFAEIQRQLQATAPEHLRLLSISIDALGDDAKALRTWLQRYRADLARWSAAAVAPESLDALFDFVRGRAAGADRHSAQVYMFDRQARLVYRTLDMPPADSVVSLMREVAKQA